MHTEEVQTEFMTALSLSLPHHLSTHQWTLEATTLEQTDQASLIHSPPRCLCQVIAGGKGKQINTSPMGLTGNLYLG